MDKEDLRNFFKHRMTEALHKDTLDSFRVRTNNSMSILVELQNVLDGWLKGYVKRFITVQKCIEECESLLKNDKCIDFSFYDSNLFFEELASFISKSSAKKDEADVFNTKRLLFFISRCIDYNKNRYLKTLMESLEELLNNDEIYEDDMFIPTLDLLDSLTSSFCCELLRLGYSKFFLYKYFKLFRNNPDSLPFEEAFEKMRDKFRTQAKQEFFVVFRLFFPTEDQANRATASVVNIKEKIDDNLKEHIVWQEVIKSLIIELGSILPNMTHWILM